VPAATLGGDFFDIIQLSDTRCAVLVCDVMGHGVRAGLLTALIRGVVKEIGANAESPAYVLGEINRSLTPILEQTGQPLFATVFLAMIDTTAGSLAFANAGHPPPFVLHRTGGAVEKLTVPDPEPAAGLIDGFAYSQHEFPFRRAMCSSAIPTGCSKPAMPPGTASGRSACGRSSRKAPRCRLRS
jgi:sigma-B regulation protein RsbU (phosphoserine phosphatase)